MREIYFNEKYILIAGVNGAGKSTLYQILNSLKHMNRVNTDEILREFGDWRNSSDIIKAGKIAVNKIKENFEKEISFNQETTLCGNSILKNIDIAKSRGYEVEVHYVGVETVEIAKQRIAYRVEHGGYGIPDTEAFNRFAIYKKGELYTITNEVPDWYKRYID